MCRIVTVSLSSLDMFICWLLYICLLSPPSLSFYTVSPLDSQYGDSIPYQLIVFILSCFSHCCLSCPFPRHRPRMIFCPPPPSLPSPSPNELAVVSNQNNIFKNSVNITLANSKGLLVGYSCIQVYIVSWWRCIWSVDNSIKMLCMHS